MTPQQRKALQESIEHWERMRDDPAPQCEAPTSEDCPCCHLYFDADCQGCPIHEHTGKRFCEETPYRHAASIWNKIEAYYPQEPPPHVAYEWKDAATEMIEFMQAILQKHPETQIPPDTTTPIPVILDQQDEL